MQKQEASSCVSRMNPCFKESVGRQTLWCSSFCRPGFLILRPHCQFCCMLGSPPAHLPSPPVPFPCPSPPGSQLLHKKEDEPLNYSLLIGILLLGNWNECIIFHNKNVSDPALERHALAQWVEAPRGTGLHWPPTSPLLCSLVGPLWEDWFSLIVVTLWPHRGLSSIWLRVLCMAEVGRVAVYARNGGLSL